jgi:hypothetical protein
MFWNDRDLRRILTKVYEKRIDQGRGLSWDDDDLDQIFRNLYTGLDAKPAYLFIDAIDECALKYQRNLVK